eukprot:g17949.t1
MKVFLPQSQRQVQRSGCSNFCHCDRNHWSCEVCLPTGSFCQCYYVPLRILQVTPLALRSSFASISSQKR